MITGRLPKPGERHGQQQRGDRREAATAAPTTRAMPKRSPSDAAVCEAAKKPSAFTAKARVKPVGVSPNSRYRRRTRWR